MCDLSLTGRFSEVIDHDCVSKNRFSGFSRRGKNR